MRQTTQKTVQVCGSTFHVFPFSAFTAANLSADVIHLLAPVIGGLMPLISKASSSAGATSRDAAMDSAGEDPGNPSGEQERSGQSILDVDIDMDKAGAILATAFRELSGDEVERVLKNLLTENRNISYESETGVREWMTQDLADELFCGQPHGLFILAFHVIVRNYSGFFGSAVPLSGVLQSVAGAAQTGKAGMFPGMASLT